MTLNKTLLAVATIASLASSASAAEEDWRRNHRYEHRYEHRDNRDWVAPAIGGLIIGGIIAGSIADQPDYYDQPCQRIAVYDQWNRFLGYRTVCR